MIRIFRRGTVLLLAALVGCPGDSVALISCPAPGTESSSGLIGPLGGVLAVGGIRVIVPVNAVLVPTSFSLTVPESNYLEIDVKAGDADHFVFERPVVVAIDYGRCGLPRFHRALSAWNIDPDTKALLEEMPSVDSQLTHTITFSTIHFSGYAVAD